MLDAICGHAPRAMAPEIAKQSRDAISEARGNCSPGSLNPFAMVTPAP